MNCTLDVKILNTALFVARCSVAFQLNKHINKLGHFINPDGRQFIPLSQTIMHFGELLILFGRIMSMFSSFGI